MPNDYNPSTDEVTLYGARHKVERIAADPICLVPEWVFRERLKNGMDPARALYQKTSTNRSMHSRLRGVTFHKPSGTWISRICHQGKEITIGYYDTEIEAGHAYDREAQRLKGPDAQCNFR